MNVRELGKILSGVENRDAKAIRMLQKLYDQRRGVPILGITGPPGAGKSALTDQLISLWRAKNQTVAVIAIDPSSPFTGGAVLGDRVRMQRHASDEGVFIRSVGSRGARGGLARAVYDLAVCFDAYGFERIIIETVGVGQTELDITGIAHTTLVVLVPEAGDAVQTMKAGLNEIADIFVVNKADRPGASDLKAMLLTTVEMQPHTARSWLPPVLETQAIHGIGVPELLTKIEQHGTLPVSSGYILVKRREKIRGDLLLELLTEAVKRELLEKIEKDEKLKKIFNSVAAGQANPYEALEKILATSK